MSSVNVRRLRKAFGSTEVLRDIDLDVDDGEFAVFVGPSGCGKSTLLRLICGLEEATSGTIAIDGEVVNDVPPARRGIAMVFQTYALYPHMSVAQNMGYALRLAGTEGAEIDRRVRAAASVLRLDALLDRKPRELSGGQRQRVAIGRAIVREPRLFLFDEPLSNLDAALRVDMRIEIAALKSRLGTTMIYVTHDQVEAMTLADKIVVMNVGRIEQVGKPLDVYRTPANRFVATFIGSPRMNLLPAVVGDDGTIAIADRVPLPLRVPHSPGRQVAVGIRAENLSLQCPGAPPQPAHGGPAHELRLKGEARLVEHLGSDLFVHVAVPGVDGAVIVRGQGASDVGIGTAVSLAFDPAHAHVFSADGVRLALA